MIDPPGYPDLTPEEKAVICNGCGPKGYGFLVPDQWGSVDFEPACNRHDYGYYTAKTEEDLHKANLLFMRNMVIIIKETLPGHHNKWNRRIMYEIAHQYFWAVETCGKSFWKPKGGKS